MDHSAKGQNLREAISCVIKSMHNEMMRKRDSTYKPIRGLIRRVQDDLLLRFLEQVKKSPTDKAIITTEGPWTYQALLDEVLKWKALFSQSLQCGDRAIVRLERTPRLLAVLLALQWLGITYIPVDLSIPFERLRTILEDSQAQAFIYDTAQEADYAELDCLQLYLTDLALTLAHESQQHPHPKPPKFPENAIVYIIYTSGSTGKPKGVAIPRLAFNNFLASLSRYFLNEKEALLLAITTLAFDIAALELFLPLWQKKTVFLANEEQRQDPACLADILNKYPITLLQATPAMWKLLAPMLGPAQSNLVALCGGEPLNAQLAKSLLGQVAEVWNMYGPTEATIWCSLKQIEAGKPITIGHPIDNTEMRVMDAALNILPPYVKGDLYIGGLCLAMGYVNNEELTQSRFIPCDNALGGRLFKVGDLACTTPEGEFIIFGRTDNQIKLHGYRMELEDIEAQIQRRFAAVRECAVSVHHEQLIAYVSLSDSSQSFSEIELRQELSTELPDYMLPQRVVLLDRLPLSASGKVNRKALPPLDEANTAGQDHKSTLTQSQLEVAQIWAAELGVPRVNLEDNFFSLGGHSLLALRIVLKIEEQMAKHISFKDFYQVPILSDFAERVADAPVSKNIEGKKFKMLEPNKTWLPLYDIQMLLWFSGLFGPSVKKFNNAARKRIQGPLDKKMLDLALQLAVQKQEILLYTINHLYPAQKQQRKWSIQWHETSLQDYDNDSAEALLVKSYDELFSQSLWSRRVPMMQAKLFYLNDEQIELQVSISHFLSDQDSMAIFFKDLSHAYCFYAHHTTLNANESWQAYMHFILRQNEKTTQNARSDAEFWGQYLKDTDFLYFPEQHIIKKAKADPKALSYSTYYELPETMLSQLRQFCVKNHLTINDVLSAAIALSLLECGAGEGSQAQKLLINVLRSTRNEAKYDRVIGCFLNIDGIKLDWRKHKTLLELAQQSHQSTLETLEYQRASTMVKYASVCRTNRFKKGVIDFITRMSARVLSRFNLYPTLIHAVMSLLLARPKNSFLITLNIFSDFFKDPMRREPDLFDAPEQPIPLYPYPIIMVKNVFALTFHRNGEDNTAFMAITANISASYREAFGKTMLTILQRELGEASILNNHYNKEK